MTSRRLPEPDPAPLEDQPGVGKFRGMATKRRKAQPAKWKGDEVQDAPGDDAERGADRAEGKTALSVEDATERSRADEAVDVPEASTGALSPEEKIAEVAEEHRERLASAGRGHGKI